MRLTNPNAPIRYPRVEADAVIEYLFRCAEQLAAETADLERPHSESFGDRRAPVYRHTEADSLAEERAESAWLTRLITQS